jgi:PAS domain S-box-containing protein
MPDNMIKNTKPLVLYLDDESINLRLFNLSFKNDYHVTIIKSGEEALELISETIFDVIVSDQRMPGISGTEFMSRAKKISPNSKFILLTGYTDIEALEKAINEVGIWQYVKKPWEPSNLRIIIDNAYSSLLVENENRIISAALRQSEKRLNLALEGTDAGVWDWNLITNEVYFSPTWKSMIGYKDSELDNNIKTWENLLHPDDLQLTFTHLDEYLNGTVNKYELEFRLKHKEGYFVHILSRGSGQKGINRKYDRLTGTHIDLSEKYKAQNEVKKLNEELEERVERRTQALKLLNIQLIQRNKFEHLISKISSELIATNSDKIDIQINQSLTDINEFSSATKSFIFQLSEGNKISVSNEINSKGNESNVYYNFNDIPINKLSLFQKKIDNNEILIIKDVNNITEDFYLEKKLLKESNISSLLMIPLRTQSDSIGCFGISFNSQGREWNQEDISLLKFIGEIFSNAIVRSRNETKIIEREKSLSKANSIILDTERKTKLLQNIASIANSPLKIDEALILSHKIIINKGKGLSGILVEVPQDELEEIEIKNIITNTEKEEENLRILFNTEENKLREIVKNTINNKEIIIKRDIEVDYNMNTILTCSFDVTSIPILVKGKVKHIFISLFPPNDNGITDLNVLSEITREISFVVDRDIIKQELSKSLLKEQELSELKSQFIAMASHQFRTPLAIIQSNIELFQMLAEQIDSSIKSKFDLVSIRIQEEVVRLTSLMNDVLLLGKLNANAQKVRIKKYNIKNVIDRNLNKLNQLQKDNRVCLSSETGEANEIILDEELFDHAFNNLIENAFKYSRESTLAPKVKIHHKSNSVIIEVIDFGRGIPQENINNLFQPFFRANNTKDIEGTGLGLVVCEKYINLQNGTLKVESIENKETIFTIEILA